MVRKLKANAERKQVTIQIRLTQEQKKILTHGAANAGLEVSTWIRTVMLQEARRLGVKG